MSDLRNYTVDHLLIKTIFEKILTFFALNFEFQFSIPIDEASEPFEGNEVIIYKKKIT